MPVSRFLWLVNGYMPNIDRQSTPAKNAGLIFRSSILFDSANINEDYQFDIKTYSVLLRTLWEKFRPDEVVIFDHETTASYSTSDEFVNKSCSKVISGSEPVELSEFRKREKIIATLEYEPWIRFGGPEPYNDCYGLTLFTSSEMFEDIKETVNLSCKETGAILKGVFIGNKFETADFITKMKRLWYRGF